MIEHNPSFVHNQLAGISPTERVYLSDSDGRTQIAVQAPVWPGPLDDAIKNDPERLLQWLRDVASQDQQHNVLNNAIVQRNRSVAALLWLGTHFF